LKLLKYKGQEGDINPQQLCKHFANSKDRNRNQFLVSPQHELTMDSILVTLATFQPLRLPVKEDPPNFKQVGLVESQQVQSSNQAHICTIVTYHIGHVTNCGCVPAINNWLEPSTRRLECP
jgi:hypothetical protein